MAVKRKQIIMSLLILGSLSLVGCPAGKQSGAVNPEEILTWSEQSVFEKINDYRRDKGLNPLIINKRIVKQARIHSRNMAKKAAGFSHAGFKERVRNTGINYRSAAENIAYNQGEADPPAVAVVGWIKSEGHRRNIEGDFNRTGIGVIKNRSGRSYFTQLFIKTGINKINNSPQNKQNKQNNLWNILSKI
jgi:uncharacterized protein YkwD